MNKDGGAMCGGVVKQSEFEEDPMAYMMAWVMPDDKFKLYAAAKEKLEDEEAKKIFDEYAWSAI